MYLTEILNQADSNRNSLSGASVPLILAGRIAISVLVSELLCGWMIHQISVVRTVYVLREESSCRCRNSMPTFAA